MRQVIRRIDFFGTLFNTVVVSVAGTALVLFLDSLASFAFAKCEFPARKSLFGIPLATYMIPGQLPLVPQFVRMAEFGWAGSLKALAVSSACTGGWRCRCSGRRSPSSESSRSSTSGTTASGHWSSRSPPTGSPAKSPWPS
ncbi:hypothetical protein [Streptomyces sp. NPDC088350]|uniref:hypothetical protein n=1 Tax=Streptomyces sp. NPDC088350 TaxID=3365854 RepID=UPI00382E029A